LDWCFKERRDVLGGRFIVVIDLEPHVSDEAMSSARFCAWNMKSAISSPCSLIAVAAAGASVPRTIVPHLILRPMLLDPHPSLGSMEEARDRAAPEENGDKLLSLRRYITANGDEIVDSPARFRVDEGLGNALDGRRNLTRQEQRAPRRDESLAVGAIVRL
jgi:hypothetical protein